MKCCTHLAVNQTIKPQQASTPRCHSTHALCMRASALKPGHPEPHVVPSPNPKAEPGSPGGWPHLWGSEGSRMTQKGPKTGNRGLERGEDGGMGSAALPTTIAPRAYARIQAAFGYARRRWLLLCPSFWGCWDLHTPSASPQPHVRITSTLTMTSQFGNKKKQRTTKKPV